MESKGELLQSPNVRQAVEVIRAEYLARVEAFAEELRPRFEAGELHGYTDEDSERSLDELFAWRHAHPGATPEEEDAWKATTWRPAGEVLEDLCEERFVNKGRLTWDEQCLTAYLVRAVAPGDAFTEYDAPTNGQAVVAISLDVLRIARGRGWYKPDPTESHLHDLEAA